MLAAATRAARRDGLPDPIPVTWRTRDAPGAHETPWQEAVVAELGLQDWVRMETGDELDYVGPVAARVAALHGPVYPANAHLHEPLAAEAAGGALLTGIGGDQIFGHWQWSRAADVLGRRARPTPRDAVRVAHARAPVSLRQGVARRRAHTADRPWLTPAADRQFARAFAAERAAEPSTWGARVHWQAARRYLALSLDALTAIGSAHDCVLVHPLLDPAVLDAVATAGDPWGFARRADALPALFPTLKPQAVAGRLDKATFRDVFTRAPSRDAASRWAGEGVDPALVDVPTLQEIWRDRVPLRSALILQQFALQHRSGPVTPR